MCTGAIGTAAKVLNPARTLAVAAVDKAAPSVGKYIPGSENFLKKPAEGTITDKAPTAVAPEQAKAALPEPATATSVAAQTAGRFDDEAAMNRRSKALRGTVLTSPLGDTSKANLGRKTLLGQ